MELMSNRSANNEDALVFLPLNSAPSGGDNEYGLPLPSDREYELRARALEHSEGQADTDRGSRGQLQPYDRGDGFGASGTSHSKADSYFEPNEDAERGDRKHQFGPKPTVNEKGDVINMPETSDCVVSSDVDVDGNVIDKGPPVWTRPS